MTGAQNNKKLFLERAKRKFQSLLRFRKWYTFSGTITTNNATNPRNVFRFCDLPVEIRLMVLEYVIGPGIIFLEPYSQRRGFAFLKIANLYDTLTSTRKPIDLLPRWIEKLEKLHLETPPKRFRKLGQSPVFRQPGFGLMATERLMYEEGHRIFYGENVFKLASGPVAIISQYFDGLEDKHRDMISQLAFKVTIADLTREVFPHVKRKVQKRISTLKLGSRCTMSKDVQVRFWVESCMETLEVLWIQRFQWLHTFPRLSILMLRSQDRMLVLSHREPRLESRSIQRPENRVEFEDFMEACRISARRILTEEFNMRGTWTSPTRISSGRFGHAVWVVDVEGIEDWLAGLEPGVRYKS